jgi:hypothetical protein
MGEEREFKIIISPEMKVWEGGGGGGEGGGGEGEGEEWGRLMGTSCCQSRGSAMLRLSFLEQSGGGRGRRRRWGGDGGRGGSGGGEMSSRSKCVGESESGGREKK